MKAEISFGDTLGHLLLWVVIIVITFGIGAFFFPYSFAKFVLNRSKVVTPNKTYALRCDLDIASQLGHIVLWVVISIITLGIGYLFYLYGVWRIAIRNTTLVEIANEPIRVEPSEPAPKSLPQADAA